MRSIYVNPIWRLAILTLAGIGLPFFCGVLGSDETAQSSARDSRDSGLRNGEALDPTKAKPHPWLVDAPPAFARLVDKGNVQMLVDQPTVEAAGKTALTIFTFATKYQTRFRMNQQAKASDGKRQIGIAVRFFDVECSVNHRILFSDQYRPYKPWEAALLPHEFDHVAISTDPRMLEMLRSIEDHPTTIIVSLDNETKASNSWAQNEIEKSVSKFQQAVEKLVQQYYVRLDDVSNNGLKSISDRSKFFMELYSESDLLKQEFSYTADVIDRINKVKLESIKQHYSLP